MPNTTNLVLPYPAGADNPAASVLAALVSAVDTYAGPWLPWSISLTQGSAVAFNTLYARYRIVNKTCEWNFALDPTGAGTAGQPIVFNLPPAVPKFTTTDMPRGIIDFVTQSNQGQLVTPAGSTTTMRVDVFAGTYTTAISATDFLRGSGRYEVA